MVWWEVFIRKNSKQNISKFDRKSESAYRAVDECKKKNCSRQKPLLCNQTPKNFQKKCLLTKCWQHLKDLILAVRWSLLRPSSSIGAFPMAQLRLFSKVLKNFLKLPPSDCYQGTEKVAISSHVSDNSHPTTNIVYHRHHADIVWKKVPVIEERMEKVPQKMGKNWEMIKKHLWRKVKLFGNFMGGESKTSRPMLTGALLRVFHQFQWHWLSMPVPVFKYCQLPVRILGRPKSAIFHFPTDRQ